MILFKLIESSDGKILLNRKASNGTAVLGTYDVHGECGMTEISDQALRELAEYILENIPEPEPLTDANLIHAMSDRSGLTYFCAVLIVEPP